MRDPGHNIDSSQNQNAVFIDQFGKSGKTSTRINAPPGGQDHFSLGWGNPEPEVKKPIVGRRLGPFRNEQPKVDNNNEKANPPQPKPSIKVRQNPGGSSNIIFGSDDTNYDHYRK